MRSCRKCGTAIDPDWPGEWHPGCYPDFTPLPGLDMSSYDMELRDELSDIIRWASRNSARSGQVALGCSEVGSACDLRIAYRMAAAEKVNLDTDPWPSVVGTSIHAWMEQAVDGFSAVHRSGWVTELEVHPSPLVAGHSDLYHPGRALVLDWKFPSPDNLRKMRQDDPSEQYMTQVQLYGLGQQRAGNPVKRVGIVALGRQGWLKDMYVHTVDYDARHAEVALQRVYDLGRKLIELNIPAVDAWDQIPRTPTRLCAWCPFWNPSADRPGAHGCPGHKR